MSILLHHQIKKAIDEKKIYFTGSNLDNLGPNSIDVTLSPILKTYFECEIVDIHTNGISTKLIRPIQNNSELNYIDMSKPNKTFTYEIPEEGLVLSPYMLYLGSTQEACGSKWFVPIYEGRSSMARLGLQSHISAGFGDINFEARWTLEIVCIHPVRIFPNIRIGQVYFLTADEDARNLLYTDSKFYSSKYNDQTEAQESKSHLDFVDGKSKSRK